MGMWPFNSNQHFVISPRHDLNVILIGLFLSYVLTEGVRRSFFHCVIRTNFRIKCSLVFNGPKTVFGLVCVGVVHVGRSRWACAGQGVSFCAGQGRWSCVGWSRWSCAGRSVDMAGVGTCRRGVDSVGV